MIGSMFKWAYRRYRLPLFTGAMLLSVGAFQLASPAPAALDDAFTSLAEIVYPWLYQLAVLFGGIAEAVALVGGWRAARRERRSP